MHVSFWLVKIIKEVEDWVCFHQDILIHKVYCLGCFVIVNRSEHFKAVIIHHFYVVHRLDVVRYLGCVLVSNYSRVFDDLLKVDVVLIALLLVKPTVVVVPT